MAEQQQNSKLVYNNATLGMNTDLAVDAIPKGMVSYALNANVENYDANGVSYGSEESNEFTLSFPEGYVVIGTHFIVERDKHIFFLATPDKSGSQIGYMDHNDGEYKVLVNSPDLNFDVLFPIQKIVHRITDCSTEIYWPDNNGRRYLDIDNIPKILKSGSPLCSPIYTDDIDVNQLNLNPNFSIPSVDVKKVTTDGNLIAGTYQFAVQYSDSVGNPYTSYYSVTNPTPIFDDKVVTLNFNYNVGKSIIVDITNLDITGLYKYFNLAVVKTINGISSVALVGTYSIEDTVRTISYTGQSLRELSLNDIYEKFPIYSHANDVTAAQDVLIWSDLTSIDRINYQNIANKLKLQWETWRIPSTENYSDEINATKYRGYLRDEVYPFEIVFLLKNGKQTDGFHIPAREKNANEKQQADIPETSLDFIGEPTYYSGDVGYSPYWKIYNTATNLGFSPEYSSDSGYKGPYQYGEFAYWESTDTYPCNTEVWGDLAGQPIRHHKFPDVLVSPINESKSFSGIANMEMGDVAIYPIGVKISVNEVQQAINSSSLSKEQKEEIIGFKIVRGDRSTHKSIIAKGILRNVGKYSKEDNDYYFPNYPYNDLNQDPFLNATNNAYTQLCDTYDVYIETIGIDGYAEVEYTDCNTNKVKKTKYYEVGSYELCSTTKPLVLAPSTGHTGISTYEIWTAYANSEYAGWTVGWEDVTEGYKEAKLCPLNPIAAIGCDGSMSVEMHVVLGSGKPVKVDGNASEDVRFVGLHLPSGSCKTTTPLEPIKTAGVKDRQIFNSPETSFGQPFLGSILKLENVIYGKGKSHFVEVKNNAKYKLISEAAQRAALRSAQDLSNDPFDATAMFTAYQAYLQIYINGITKKNYAYSYNSIADYIYTENIPNNQGIKQRNLDVSRYLIPGVQSISGDKINNYQRESSVYLKTKEDVLFPHEQPSIAPSGYIEKSRTTISKSGNCATPNKENDINVISYYASLKNQIDNQWAQIYSYNTIDTGYQVIFDDTSPETTIFGGDTFISKFSFKTKLPFFIDNRVNAPDDSDIFYDEIGNIAYPKYWHSSRSILKDYTVEGIGTLSNIISYKAHNFDCPNEEVEDYTISTSTTTTTVTTAIPQAEELASNLTYYDGYYYLFAYGIPSFYCETSYNLDLRQAFNNKEGEFWPHVSSGIPDDWVQESFVPIAQDNTYYYNTTYSKQNKETSFSHLPVDWDNICYTTYPFRAVYSDNQYTGSDSKINNWRVYKGTSYFDFPQNYGSLTSLDGIQNRAILARFENKTLLYGNLLTVDTSNPQAAYFGNPNLFKGTPPIDFADTDLGFVGSQHKFLLKIPQGQISVDAKRGQVFLIQGTEITDLSQFGSGMNRFFTDHLAFEILRYFPEVDVDNAYNGIGICGVYDAKYDRVIITKLDYIPLQSNVLFDHIKQEFYIEEEFETNVCNVAGIAQEVANPYNNLHLPNTLSENAKKRTKIELTDEYYFCNKSWTLSYNMNTKSWISFHSYLPNWYIGENNFFYSGQNNCCDEIDFIVGELDTIPTTTTTSTSTSTTTTTSSTTTTTSSTITTTTTEQPVAPIVYGLLYNWYTLTDVRNISNTGWHVPSMNEYKTLADYIGASGDYQTNIVGDKLKEIGDTYWYPGYGTETNEYGFNGRGAGERLVDFQSSATWQLLQSKLYLLTTDEFSVSWVYNSGLYSGSQFRIGGTQHDRKTAGSIRLIKDSTTLTHGQTGIYIGNDGKVYSTICIGTQEWLSQNLTETKYRNGDWINGYNSGIYTPITDSAWAALTSGATCALYDDWSLVMN